MSEIIFKNPRSLKTYDIFLPALFGFCFLLIIEKITSLYRPRLTFSWPFALVFNGIFVTIWLVLGIVETTFKEIKIENDKVIFTIQRQLKKDAIVKFSSTTLNVEMERTRSRSLRKNYLLTIYDGLNKLHISSDSKGMSEEVLKAIAEKLKHLNLHSQ